jgi:hypothetical protein
MTSLTRDQKDAILEFYFRCGDEENVNRGRDLIASIPAAAELYARLEETLTQLDSIKYEACPDNLAELTIARLKLAASSGQRQLQELLAEEQKKGSVSDREIETTKRSFWRIAEIAAAAAMIVVGLSLAFGSLSNARQIERQNMCKMNLARAGRGIQTYAKDNEGALPAVSMAAGSPWWKIGDRRKENNSNTRHVWLLVKGGYVKQDAFVCPGRKDGKILNFSPAELSELNDFPSRQNIGYSYALMCDKTARRQRSGALTVLMADSNPVFEKIFKKNAKCDGDRFSMIFIDDKMRQMRSANHKGKGQNILFSLGSAEFKDKRIILDDDIYMINNTDVYSGCEVPRDDSDIFLVP